MLPLPALLVLRTAQSAGSTPKARRAISRGMSGLSARARRTGSAVVLAATCSRSGSQSPMTLRDRRVRVGRGFGLKRRSARKLDFAGASCNTSRCSTTRLEYYQPRRHRIGREPKDFLPTDRAEAGALGLEPSHCRHGWRGTRGSTKRVGALRDNWAVSAEAPRLAGPEQNGLDLLQ